MDSAKIEDVLKHVNGIVAQLNPLLGAIGPIAIAIAQLFRKNGDETSAVAFEQKMAEWDAERANLAAAIDDFHKKFPKTV